MMKMQAYKPSTHIAVRDCDDDLSDDVEDDVFIRDRKSRAVCEENGLKRPLMAPRRKTTRTPISRKNNVVSLVMRKQNKCWRFCEPFVYAFSVLVVLISAVFLIAYLLSIFPVTVQKIKLWLRDRETIVLGRPSTGSDMSLEYNLFKGELTPCTQMTVHKVWSKSFSNLNSESPVRKYDITNDGIEDIIIGFHVDENFEYGMHSSVPKCEVDVDEYRQMVQCKGGILALDGATGATIWQRWTSYHIFSLVCKQDLNSDGQADCIASGRGEYITAINTRNGDKLWEVRSGGLSSSFSRSSGSEDTSFELFTVNVVRDLDDDTVGDILAVHLINGNDETSDTRKDTQRNAIQLISGQSGKVIKTIAVPYQEDVYVPLQIITLYDGTEAILVVTGGQNSPGGLYLINLYGIMQLSRENEFTTIFRNPDSGFMVAPILTDINNDGIEDIVAAMFNSTVYAFNGYNLKTIWKFSFPNSESISSIVPGHYNHDNVPDFMIKYSNGPGYPIYYYSQTQILNGIDGTPLLEQTINDSGGPNSFLGGLSVSQTFGGDFFFHWQTLCREKTDVKDVYRFIPDSDVLYQSRADTCMLRYNRSTILKLYAITRHIKSPGAVIFSTDDLILQLNESDIFKQVPSQSAVSPLKHPKMFKKNPKKNVDEENRQTSVPNSEISNDFQQLENKPYHHASAFREISGPTMEGDPPISMDFPQNNDNLNTQTHYGRPIINHRSKNRHNNEKAYEKQSYQQQQLNSDEYDNYYDDINRQKNYNNKYETNRDIRSELNQPAFANPNELPELIKAHELPKPPMKSRGKPETLWDLEFEKEEKEAQNDYNYNESLKYTEKKVFRREDALLGSQGILPTISSVGVLLKSLDSSNSTLDLVFLLTVRESELYPPLFLPEDVACIEDKLSRYRIAYGKTEFTQAERLRLEKIFLKSCLETRLPNLTPHNSQYESQIVVTRLSIKCACGILKTGETCSTFKPIDEQKWTEFMGNSNNGLYPILSGV